MDSEKLRQLLLNSISIKYTDECLIDISNYSFDIEVNKKPFEKSQQLEILRKRVQSTNSETIRGIVDTFKGVEAFSGSHINIVIVTTTNRTYLLYTNREMTQLLGIIINNRLDQEKRRTFKKDLQQRGFSD